MSPRTLSTVQIFSFWSFEISEGILRNQKVIGLDSFSNQGLNIFAHHLVLTNLCIDHDVEKM